MNQNPTLHIDGKNVYIGSKLIAQIGDGACTIERSKERHFYRALNSWCLNYELVKEMLDKNVKRIQIVDKKAGKTYELELTEVQVLMQKFNAFLSFGTEKQVAVPLSLWEVYGVRNGKDVHEVPGISAEEFANTTFTGRWGQRIKRSGSSSQNDIFGGLDD